MPQFEFKKMAGLLERYGLPLCKSKLVKSSKDAVKAARVIGWPVVLKVVSKDVIHKSDVGGVITDILNDKQLEAGFEGIMKQVKKGVRRARIDGVLVQRQCCGQEVIVGMKRDAQFGPVIMFGLGGVFVEVMKDVVFRVCPVNKKMAMEMVSEIKALPVLKGMRGKKGVNIDAIVDIITRVSKMAMDKKDIAELDLNPVIVDEKKASIVDVRMVG